MDNSPEPLPEPLSEPTHEEAVRSPADAYPAPYRPHADPDAQTVADRACAPAQAAQPNAARVRRDEALDLLGRLKATLVAGSVVAFGVFAALAASHITGVTARASSQPASAGSQGASSTPTATTPPSDDGGFFNSAGAGNGFGVGAPGAQSPASGTTFS